MTLPPTSRPTIIEPPRRWPGLGLGEAWRYRSTCLVLARRSRRAKYRQTYLGAAWALVQPLILMVIFTAFFGAMARMPAQGLPYPVFFLTALIIWHPVAKTVVEGSGSVINNAPLLNRIYFPRIYFPVSVGMNSLADLGFGLIALVIVLLAYAIIPGPQVLLVPVFVAIAGCAALGVTFWLSALNAAYRDVAVMVPLVIQAGFFLSPIIYPSSIVPPQWAPIYYLNPMVLVIDGFRWAFAGTPAPSGTEWIIGTTASLLLLAGGYLWFRGRERTLADVV